MITHTIKSLDLLNARYARDLEYIREMAETDSIDDAFNHAVDQIDTDPEQDDEKETKQLVDMIDTESAFEDEEINRILESSNDRMTLDEVMGIDME